MKGFSAVPGPRTLPILGNALGYSAPEVGRDRSQSPRIWKHFNQTYGPLVRLEFPRMAPTVLVFDPNVAEKVYRHEGDCPMRPAFFSLREAKNRNQEPPSLQGVLTSNGEDWWSFRRKIQKPLMQGKQTAEYVPLVCSISRQFVEHISRISDENGMVSNFSDEIYKWALEAISAIVLETRLGCLEGEMDSGCLLMIEMIQKILKGSKNMDIGLRLWEIFPSKEFNEFFLNYKIFTKVAYKHIQEAENRPPDLSHKSLISSLSKAGCDKQTISAMAADLMFGGVDTTSHATIFSLYLLATNQEKQEKLVQEIKSTPVLESKLLRLPYLRAVMKESLRMMPPALGNMRQLNQGLEISSCSQQETFHLAPDTIYILAHQTMSNSEQWVKEPGVFRPERWIRGNSEHEEIHPYVSLPFGYGKRMCIGRRLAEMEMSSLIAETLSTFKVGWTGGTLQIKSDTLIFPDGKLDFTFTPR